MQLGNLLLFARDTAGAINSFKTAVDLRAHDGWVRYLYGNTLLEAGRLEEAAAELKQATVLEPYFAAPYYGVARASELRGDRTEAVTWYRQFLEHASRADRLRTTVEARLRELGS